MKKKVLSLILAAAMCLSLAACGAEETTSTGTTPAASTETSTEEQTPVVTEGATGEITLWVADAVVDFTLEECNKFISEHPEYAGFTVTVEPVGEGDAAGNMITDVEGGADIYGFAQDQLARLVSAGALTPINGDYATAIEANNDAGSASAAKVGGVNYAFPLTSDNGYFLYYDKSVVTDPTSLEAVVADCEAAGKNFYMEINSGWYQPAFFFATGCELTYDTNDEGNFTACNISYATDAGLVAFKKMIEVASSKAFVNGSSISNGTNIGAIVDGTWDAASAKDIFGDNYACAKLPSFTGVDGNTYQLSGFGGFKLLGVKPQEDPAKLQACLALANFLAGEEVQLARYNVALWGPSNINVQANEAVKADEALSALGEQLAYAIPQGQYPGDYWSLATSLGDDVIAGTVNADMDDAALLAVLQNFQDTCTSYAQ